MEKLLTLYNVKGNELAQKKTESVTGLFLSKELKKQKKSLAQKGFKPLKTVALFWSSASERWRPDIFSFAKYLNNDLSIGNNNSNVYDWTEHENVFAIVHCDDGFLGYFSMKNIEAETNVQNRIRFVGLHFKNFDTGARIFIPLEKMHTLLFPDGKYTIMTIPVDKIVVAFKRNLTFKMWFG